MNPVALLRRLAPTVSIAAALAACDSTVQVDGSGGSGTGGSGTGGDISSVSGTPCDDYKDQLPLATVTFRVRNDWFEPVYVPAGCDEINYQLQPASGPDDLGYGNFGGACNQSCGDLQTEGMIFCGACAPSVYRIGPGETLEFTWGGQALEPGVNMPDFCWFDPGAGTTCNRILGAGEQDYTISLTGFDECLDCMCDAGTGLCYGNPSGQQATTTPVTFPFPQASADGVDVNFDGCAFGCP